MAINLARYETMDPYILLSAVNMILRDDGLTLEQLCAAQELDEDRLKKRLGDAGFAYDQEQRQFK